MHPILGRVNRLVVVPGRWTIAAVLVAAVLTRLGLAWVEALVLLLPLFVVYAFACLSAWYVCRAMPLRASSCRACSPRAGLRR